MISLPFVVAHIKLAAQQLKLQQSVNMLGSTFARCANYVVMANVKFANYFFSLLATFVYIVLE